ncbi:hypothetical protein PRIPAC_85273 [Pristionchus pacificus]|uniref:Uncharacterized protein n=1 Tax=Pristionchus pacificus TaxID=54126 RepID=A0A2A6BTU2_PRIPA|nr:hypothetical protein PRIPAC_85273 [Pristionchus pacificus]|eukprot:PDM69314.1 hypothetical protein PRIPAC_47616 [Pristionchus pacificus]
MVQKLQAPLACMFNAASTRGIGCPVDSRTGVERIVCFSLFCLLILIRRF